MEPSPSADRAELQRNLIIAGCCAPIALLIYAIAHAAYTNLFETTQAMGSVDPATHVGLDLGYLTMIGGTAIFALLALIAVVRAWRVWRRLRHAR